MALLIIEMGSEGSSILVKGRFEITLSLESTHQFAIRRGQMIFRLVQSPLQLNNGGSAMQLVRSTGSACIRRRQYPCISYPFSFYDRVNCIGRHVLKCLGLPVRPTDFH
jgi:hypothetical protein